MFSEICFGLFNAFRFQSNLDEKLKYGFVGGVLNLHL
nr:MAG TPA: hypothetical protein [Caudoviricetes sp.]